MSLHIARLLSVALIGVCLTTPALAKTHTAKHAKAAVSKTPALIWRGDVTTANGVVNEVALAWEKAGHGRIELQPFNTASGIDAVSIGTADLAGSARASDGSAQNTNLTFTPVAWDALVMVTQSSNPIRNLTLKQVHDIYFGKITNWSEVGGNNAPIDLYAVASPGDGVEYSLRQLLFGRGDQPVAAPRLYVNTRKLEEGVELNPNGLGASTLADINGNPKLRAIPINGIAPTATTVGNGSYVLFTPIYLVTNPRSPKATEVAAFVDFLQTDAAKAAMRKHAVLPYQDGATLASVDAARRSTILAELGIKSRAAVSAAAPAATQGPAPTAASRTAVASAVSGTIAAGHEQSNAADNATSSTATATAAKAADTASASGKTYIVVKGDTLSGIAKKNGVGVAELREWNHLKSDNIKLGQSLRVSRS
jgi:phosphate transport system substrate-binding protein